jgi:hypothetical protein
MLLDSCTLLVESVVLGTSEGVFGRRMALWQTGWGSGREALGGAHEGALRKHCDVCLRDLGGGVEILAVCTLVMLQLEVVVRVPDVGST